MTFEEFKHLKDGTVLYDANQSRRQRRHVTATVQGHERHNGGIKVYSEGIEEIIPYDMYLLYDVMPDDESSLPFY